MKQTEFLVIGAGPFGLATAAYAKHLGMDVTVLGRTLEFWNLHMPRGMLLRSDFDWHLDARDMHTFEAYMDESKLSREMSRPIPVSLFSGYVDWFMRKYELIVTNQYVANLAVRDGRYVATLKDGSEIHAPRVLLCLGFKNFRNLPSDLVSKLPRGSFAHTCDLVDFESVRNQRVLIIGGRQSAHEWAALLRESGADEVHISYRHPAPRFAESHWSWVQPMVRLALEDHSWWRKLPAEERERIQQKFFAEGRLKLEPWLGPRILQKNIHIHSQTNIRVVTSSEALYKVELDNGEMFEVDQIILATGYRSNMRNIAFLDEISILNRMNIEDGCPVLDPEFQSSLPGLYITGFAAARDFGPFFGFTVACPVAAKIIGDEIKRLL
jgi:cation diffusion facilitator CzcD-associated flavoprotein CzcO